MAFNIQNVKNALNPAASTVPPGWHYDAAMDQYVNDQGLRVDALEAARHGNLIKAIINIHGPQALQMATGHISQAAVHNGGFVAQTIDNLTVSDNKTYSFANPPTSVIQIKTNVGTVGVNLETGDITIPPGIGRDEAIREFWLGFQKHFNPFEKAKYEVEINGLKRDYERLETYYKAKFVEIEKDSAKFIVEKVRKKYGSEKFIMVKPEDLIKFIEGA